VARISGPSLGAAGIQEKDTWTVAVAHRWQYSDRHFVGDVEQVYREKEGSEVINDVHVVDLSASYTITKRISATLAIPFQFATRSQAVRDTRRVNGQLVNPSGYPSPSGNVGGKVIDRYETQADGLSDIRLLGTAWIFDPDKYKTHNISLGLGVVLPTGEKDHMDTFTVFATDAQGNYAPRAEKRNVDNSIQPGSGAWGIIFDMYAFQQIATNFNLYLNGTYVSYPETDAGVYDGANGNTGRIWSTGDSYMGRLGVAWTFLPQYGLTLTFGGRIEGSPPKDFIGADDGRRRPGYAVSVEPGIAFSKNKWFASFSTPVAVYRVRQNDFTGNEGDAAFADFMTLFSVGRNF
jgi:hypothetical protein